MIQYKRLTALVMAAVMVLSLAGCGGGAALQKQPAGNVQLQRPVPNPGATAPEPTVPATSPVVNSPAEEDSDIQLEFLSAPAVEPDRDSLEQVAELVTGGEKDFEDLTDEELTDLIEDQIRQQESAGTPAIPGSDAVSDDPAVDTEAASDGYDGNGAMTVPFDQLYPELVEEEQVAYDEETLLLKLHRRQKRSHYGDGGFPQLQSVHAERGIRPQFPLPRRAFHRQRVQ